MSTSSSSAHAAESREPLLSQLQAERAGRELAERQVADLQQELATAKEAALLQHHMLMPLLQNVRMGLMLVDSEGRVTFINQRFCTLFGLSKSPADLCGRLSLEVAQLIQPLFANPAAYMAKAKGMRKDSRSVLNEEIPLADGRVLERGYIVLKPGVTAGHLICYSDVTARHQREAHIRTLSRFPAHNPDPILRLTPGGELLYANPAAQPLAKNLTTCEASEFRDQLQTLVQTALRTTEQQREELHVSDHYYLVVVVPMPAENHATLYLTNITERRVAENRLAEQQEFYETILEHVPAGITVFDEQHRYLFVNPEVTPDPELRAWMIGKSALVSHPRRQRSAELTQMRQRLFEQSLQERREISWEETLVDAAGTRYLLRCFRPVFNANGSVRFVVTSGIDITERRQAEDKLAEQREFYETILNQLPTDVAVVDEQHRFLFVNPIAIKDPAVREWAIGKTNLEYMVYRQLPSEIAEQREAMFHRMITERRQINFEETFMAPDGPRRLLRCLHPVLAPDGSVRLIIIYGVNITDRYRAEQQLAEQREFYETILNQLPTDIAVFDNQHRYLFVNPIAIKDTAVRKWIIGKSNLEYMAYRQRPLEIAERRAAMFSQVMTERQQMAYEETLDAPDGPRRLLRRLQPILAPDGTVRMVIAYGLDITDRYRAEQQLVEQREFYETILNQLPTDIRVFDDQHRYLFVNPAGIKSPEIRAWIIGKTNFEYFAYRQRPMEMAEKRQAVFEQVMTEQQQVKFEETIIAPDGPRHLLRIFHPVVTPAGTVRMIIAYGLDITDRYRAEQQLAKQRTFYETILNKLSIAVAVFDAGKRCLFVNPSSIQNPEIRQWVIGKNNFEYCTYRQLPVELATRRHELF